MAEPVRIVGGNNEGLLSEGITAQVDSNHRLMVSSVPGVVAGAAVADSLNQFYEDTNFVTGDSPAVHDFNADAGRNARDGWIICDGAGSILVDFSPDGITYGDKFTMKSGEIVRLTSLNIDKIRVTFVADSAYRIFLI